MPIPLTEFDKPTGAARFRVEHGRYRQRWYRDHLPACDLAPASDLEHPSVSIVKKASGSDWSNVTIKRLANALLLDPRRFDTLAHEQITAAMRDINKADLGKASGRGTDVHLMFESRLLGKPWTPPADSEAHTYLDAVDRFFDEFQPTLMFTECVAFNRTLNGHGYGGTFDAIVTIGAKTYLVDWKSRGEGQRPAAYPEEACQLGGYYGADYIIGDDDVRRPFPHVDGGLIVAVHPEGCRVYPIDLDKALEQWEWLHAWWVARLDERKPIGRVWPLAKSAPPSADSPADVEERAGSTVLEAVDPADSPTKDALAARFRALTGADQAACLDAVTAGLAAGDLAAVAAAIDAVDPFVQPTPELRTARFSTPVKPDDSITVTPGVVKLLQAGYSSLIACRKSWIGALLDQANDAGVPLGLKGDPSQRRVDIVSGLVELAGAYVHDDDTDAARADVAAAVRALLANVIGDELAQSMSMPVGALLGSLSPTEAEGFRRAAETFARTGLGYTINDAGVVAIAAA